MWRTNIQILGTEITRGSSHFLEMEVAKLHTRNHISVPVIVERAKKDGPVMLILGGVHGDETNGVAIVRDIIRKKLNKPEKGTVICIPVLNAFGYLNQDRKFPDGRDLNRMFPGSPKGSLAAQFAYSFMQEIAPQIDYALDYHTGGAARENFPNVRFTPGDNIHETLAKVFDAPFILESKNIKKSLRDALDALGVPTLVFEGGKALHLDKKMIKIGVQGAQNVMCHLGMFQAEAKDKTKSIHITKSKWIRAGHAGLFESQVENGSFVRKKEKIGRISDPYGLFEKSIKAPFDCYVFGLNTSPIINKGDALFHVSVELAASSKEQ